jgi:hypothetical protein
MSSLAEKTISLVPVFEGFSHRLWAEKVCHFAMLNSFINTFDKPKKHKKPVKPEDNTDFFRCDQQDYYKKQQKAMGLIHSCVSPTIAEALNHEFKVLTIKKTLYASITSVPNSNTELLSIVFRLGPNTGAAIKEVKLNPALMMAYIEQLYGQNGVVELFNLFTSMMHIWAPEGADPCPRSQAHPRCPPAACGA